jgi:hypothetical protein
VPENQHNHRAHDRNKKAVQIQSGNAHMPKRVEQPSANHGSDDAQHEVEHQTFAALVHNFASDESGQESQNNPGKDTHIDFSLRNRASSWAATR